MATELRNLFQEMKIFPPATGDLELRREAWLSLPRVFDRTSQESPLKELARFAGLSNGLNGLKFHRCSRIPWSLTDEQARDLIFILLDTMRTDRAVELRAGRWYLTEVGRS